MPVVTAPVTDELLVWLVELSHSVESQMIIHPVVLPSSTRLLMKLAINPVLFNREISHRSKRQVLRRNEAFDVSEFTIWTARTETKEIIDAKLLLYLFRSMIKLTLSLSKGVPANLAKATLVIWAWL